MLNAAIQSVVMLGVVATVTTQELMEQCALKNVNICLNTNIYSYLETSGGQSSIL